jgi:hypothetical protein
MQLNLRWHLITVRRPPHSPPAKHGNTRVEKMKTTLIPSSKCLELCQPIHPKPMSAHSVILVLGRQTSVSPALITYLNHEKIIAKILGAITQIFSAIS